MDLMEHHRVSMQSQDNGRPSSHNNGGVSGQMNTSSSSHNSPLSVSCTSKPSYCTPNPVPNVPENNQVKLIDYRGAKIAAFTVEGRELICLPQSFELFLKHLVGGLHTVYTKLKRLEVTPVVCNVEQVRILRSLGAIQPGVNRCKLIAPKEFDVLYEDCTNSSSARPGRPPKRSNTASPECPMSESMKRGSHFDSIGQSRNSEMPPMSFRFPLGEETKKLLGGGTGPPFPSAYYPGCGAPPQHVPSGPHHSVVPPHLSMMPFLPFGSSSGLPLSPSAAVFYHQTRLLHQQQQHQQGTLLASLGRQGSGPIRFGGGLREPPLSGKPSPTGESPSEFLQNPLDNNLPSESSGSDIEAGDKPSPSFRPRHKTGDLIGPPRPSASLSPSLLLSPQHSARLPFRALYNPTCGSPHSQQDLPIHLHQRLKQPNLNNNQTDDESDDHERDTHEERKRASSLDHSCFPPRPDSAPLWTGESRTSAAPTLEHPGPLSAGLSHNGALSPLDTCVVEIENLLRTVADNARAIERFQATASYDLRNAMNAEHQKIKLMKQQLFEEKQRRTIFQKKWKKERRLRVKLEELMSCLQSQTGVNQGGSESGQPHAVHEKPQDLSMHSSRLE